MIKFEGVFKASEEKPYNLKNSCDLPPPTRPLNFEIVLRGYEFIHWVHF